MKVAAVFGNRIFADERKDRGSLWMTHVDPKFKDGILTGDKGVRHTEAMQMKAETRGVLPHAKDTQSHWKRQGRILT